MNNHLFFAVAQTKTAIIKYSIEICSLSSKNCTAFVHKEKFYNLCRDGCSNFNRKWSCPPLSPCFQDFAEGLRNIYIFYLRANLTQFDYIKNDYLKIKAANSILKSRADSYLRSMTKQHDKYISSGSCRLCKPCKFKKDMPCAHPNVMSYSFEALGVDVGALVNMYFQEPLLWYLRGNLPEYTSVVCGLLTNDELTFENLQNEYQGRIIL